MELSKALESIISMMGERVLIEDKCINALVDLKAFEFDPAIKNIFRVLKYEGYLEKINSNTDLGKIASEIERNYGFKKPLIEYIISSYAKALGIVQESNLNPSSSYCENDKDSTLEKTNTPQKPWGKMTYPEKIIYLEQKIEIDQQSFLECGIMGHIQIPVWKISCIGRFNTITG